MVITSCGRAHTEPAAGQVEDPVDVVDDRIDLVGHEHHGALLLMALLVDEGADGLLVVQVQGQQRLVAEQHLRVGGQGLGHAQPLLLAARELPDRHLGVVGGPDEVQQLVDPAVGLGGSAAGCPSGGRRRRAPRGPGRAWGCPGGRASAAGCSRSGGCPVPRDGRRGSRCPECSSCSPSSTLRKLVLPLPLGPRTAKNSPGLDVQVQVFPERPLAELQGGSAQADHWVQRFLLLQGFS